MTYYTSAGGRPQPRLRSDPSTRQGNASTQAMAKAEQAQALQERIDAILSVHRTTFAQAARPLASPPPAVDAARIKAEYQRAARASTSFFARAERKVALEEADKHADHEATAIAYEWEQQRVTWQASLDGQWNALNDNDPETALRVLAAAFEDNEARAAAIGVDQAEVSLVVMVPDVDAVPERKPGMTPAGNISLKKLTKSEAAHLYNELVSGYILATVREALAVTPGSASIRVVAVRPTGRLGGRAVDPLVAARLHRAALLEAPWHTALATEILTERSDELLLRQRGATKALTPLDLTEEPELRDVVNAISFDR